MIRRLVTLTRRLLGLTLFAWAGWQLWRTWSTRRVLVGVTPWGEPTGLQVTPLDPRERAAAEAREGELFGAGREGYLTARLAPEEADCGCT